MAWSRVLLAMPVLLLAACSAGTTPDAPPEDANLLRPALRGTEAESVVPGELLVKFRDTRDVAARATAAGVELLRMVDDDGLALVRVAAGSERAEATRLTNSGGVEYAEPNYLRQLHAINPLLWAFRNPGGLNMSFTSGGTGPIPASYASLADKDEDAIEGFGAGGAAVVIGSLDSGVDLTHPEFTGRLIAGQDWVTGDGNPSDEDGHGTHTTGTMAGTTVGVAGITGAGPNVRVHVQRVCGATGCPTSAIVNALNAARVVPGMVAVNMSLGGGSISTAERNAIQALTNAGILVIASAGNNGTAKVACPACDANAISVAATNWRDVRTGYSQYGSGLDISAPGGECFSNTTQEGCIYSAVSYSTTFGRYDFYQGTSMSAPQVTGAAAVVASKLGLRGAALRSRLLSTVDAVGSARNYGAGRLNVYRAVTGTTLPTPQ